MNARKSEADHDPDALPSGLLILFAVALVVVALVVIWAFPAQAAPGPMRPSIGVDVDLDIGGLVRHYQDVARIRRTLRCGIKVPGHTIVAPPKAEVIVRRKRYLVPDDGQISFVDLRDSEHARVNGRRVSLANGEQDQFGFRRVEAGR